MDEYTINKFQQAGLSYNNRAFYYSDRYSQLSYKECETSDDQTKLPFLCLFTRKESSNNWQYAGLVSYIYNFVGNQLIVDSICDIIRGANYPVITDSFSLSPKLSTFWSDILIENRNTIPEVGTVYPTVRIWNSYDGSRTAEAYFGICLQVGDSKYSLGFKNTLSSFKQVHTQHSKTNMTYFLGDYVNTVNTNIVEFIQTNLNNTISEEVLLSSLDLVEKIGKKKRDAVSDYLKTLTSQQRQITSWDLFLAITRFSTMEKNLNAKILMENIVEKTMVIPVRMMERLEDLRQAA